MTEVGTRTAGRLAAHRNTVLSAGCFDPGPCLRRSNKEPSLTLSFLVQRKRPVDGYYFPQNPEWAQILLPPLTEDARACMHACVCVAVRGKELSFVGEGNRRKRNHILQQHQAWASLPERTLPVLLAS